MKYRITSARRLTAIAAAAVAGLGISSAAAYAATSASAAPAAAATPACTADSLGVWVAVDQGNGAAGTIYYPLEFTNLSGHACSLYGYPGVSAVSGAGKQLGSPAGWGSLSGAKRVILAPGATAHTILGYHDVAVSTSAGCDPVNTTFKLSVIPPGQRTSTDAAFDLEACSRPGVVYMSIVRSEERRVGKEC